MAEATQASAAAERAYPSDEEILGIDRGDSQAAGEAGQGASGEDGGVEIPRADGVSTRDDSQTAQAHSSEAVRSTSDAVRDPSTSLRASAPPEWLRPLIGDAKVGKEAKALWEQHQAYREIFPTVAEARAVKEFFPGGLEEARQALARVEEFDRIDDAYFGADPRGQAQLVEYLLANNPQAFQRMLGEAARVLAERDPVAYRAFARQFADGTQGDGEISRSAPFADTQGRQDDKQNALRDPSAELALAREQLNRERQEFRAAQYSSFQQSANDAVVGQVRQAIEQTVAGVLPATVADGARKRIAEVIFSEVNATLQNDRALTRQVATLLRSWQFTDEVKQQVANLIFGRARTLLPAVAKRVVSDWTSSVLSANRAKLEKQETAARRVDITGGGAQGTVGKRPLTPKDIDYHQTTDEQILSL